MYDVTFFHLTSLSSPCVSAVCRISLICLSIGTSMSSPNACGCFTLLLSGLKQQQTDAQRADPNSFIVAPPRLRLAVENACQFIKEVDVLGQNNGLIQVENAWIHLMANKEDTSLDIPIRFTVMSRRFSRGIYLRQPSESAVSSTFKVEIKPQFSLLPEGDKETVYFGGRTIQQTKISFEMRLSLVSSCDWIKAPPKVLLVQAGKLISIQVDPTKLSPGVHVEFIRAYDENNLEKGCVFKIPVTVVKPQVMAPLEVAHCLGTNLNLPPSERIRRFLVPPPGCSFIDVVVKDRRVSCASPEHSDDSSTRMVWAHRIILIFTRAFTASHLHITSLSYHLFRYSLFHFTLQYSMVSILQFQQPILPFFVSAGGGARTTATSRRALP